jgi:hypothetical protein
MAITIDSSGKPAYMFQAGVTSTDGVWYQLAAKTDSAAGYEWGGTHTFLNTVTTDAAVFLRDGFNNFLNPAARDAALPSPVHGTLAFVRQDAGGSPINQIQFYNGSAWVANDGDINGVTAGTGLTGGGTAGTVTLNIDTAVVATTNNTLTMSGKTLTTPTINGATITGTFTSTATLNQGTYVQPVIQSPEERWNIVASAATGTVNLDINTAGVLYYTSNATGNWTLNVRGSSSTSLNSVLATGDSITVVFFATNGATPYYQTAFQIDGSAVTPKWQNGTAPSAGNANSIDIYSFTIAKTADATFTAFGSQTRFA